MIRGRRTKRVIPLVINADTATYDLYTAAGSPADPVEIILTINAGKRVYGAGGLPAIRTGVLFALGSTWRLVNNGAVFGQGGTGAPGGNTLVTAAPSAGGNGGTGGDAIDTRIPVIVDNTSGNIFGGGGGAAGGGAAADTTPIGGGTSRAAGGGGGGGRGGINGFIAPTSHGPGGAGGGSDGFLADGAAGGDGTQDTGAGGGGAGGSTFGNAGGIGGNGGDWGTAGGAGTAGSGLVASAGGVGGAAGYAVRLNGQAITWLGGNTGAQVKGAVA